MNSTFKVEDDWCSSPLNLGTPSMINTSDTTAPQTSKPKQASSPLKLSQRQRQLQQQQNSSNDQVKVYVEPTLYVQRILETNLSGTQRKLSPVIELLPVEAQMLTITSEVVTPKLLAREAKAREAAAAAASKQGSLSEASTNPSQVSKAGNEYGVTPNQRKRSAAAGGVGVTSEGNSSRSQSPSLINRHPPDAKRQKVPSAAKISQQPTSAPHPAPGVSTGAKQQQQDTVLVRLTSGQVVRVPKSILQKVGTFRQPTLPTQPPITPQQPTPRLPQVPTAVTTGGVVRQVIQPGHQVLQRHPITTVVTNPIIQQQQQHLRPQQQLVAGPQQRLLVRPGRGQAVTAATTTTSGALFRPSNQASLPPSIRPPQQLQLIGPLLPNPLGQVQLPPAAQQAVTNITLPVPSTQNASTITLPTGTSMPPLQGKLSDLLTKIAPGGGAVQLQQATTTAPPGGVQKNHHQPQLIQSVNGVIRKLQLNPMQVANGLGKPAGSADVKIKAFQGSNNKTTQQPAGFVTKQLLNNEFGVGKLGEQFDKVCGRVGGVTTTGSLAPLPSGATLTVATPAAAVSANGLVKGVSATGALPGATSVIMRAPSVVTVSNSARMAPSSIQKSAATPMSFGKPVPVVATKSPAPPVAPPGGQTPNIPAVTQRLVPAPPQPPPPSLVVNPDSQKEGDTAKRLELGSGGGSLPTQINIASKSEA